MASLDTLKYSYPSGSSKGPGSRQVLSWRGDPEVSSSDIRLVVSVIDGDGEDQTYVSSSEQRASDRHQHAPPPNPV